MPDQGNDSGIDAEVQLRKGTTGGGDLIGTREVQPLGFRDSVNARVPGFEDITSQPDWGDGGFSGRKSDMRVVRFDRLPHSSASEQQSEQDRIDTDA